jgi:hypothetical protein
VNASATARENASIDSVVGQLNGYESALKAGDIQSAAAFLASAASQPVTPEMVQQVNTRLGFKIDAASADALATLAREQQ